MPVTAKLSRNFYEKLGDDVATELVEWFNAVDATYRTDLRELNELNFARFDAKVGQRFAEFRFDMDRRFAEIRAEFRIDLANTKAELMRWMLGLWIPIALGVIGLYLKH
jgi:hypothetical protein